MGTRKNNGQFDVGNSFGVGRPSRAVELDYLKALSDAVPVGAWAEICQRAVDDAKNGDAKARQWLSEHLLAGSSLLELAKLEAVGVTSGDHVRGIVDYELNGGSVLERVLKEEQGATVLERSIHFAQEKTGT